MAVERVFRIYWGPTLENALDFAYPVVGSSPTAWRGPRQGSLQVSNGANTIGWITGRYYRLKVTAQYFAAAQFAGGGGLQAFLDWAADSNAFTLVPNLNTPGLQVTGCYLEGPFTKMSVALEGDASQTVELTLLHPTNDLGLAFRGLWFEYDAGGSLTDPLTYTYSRANVGYELNNQGYLTQNPAGTLCDGHYPAPYATGLQTALLEMAVTNDLSSPEDLTNAVWTKSLGTITANAAKAPDGNLTGDLFVEDATVTAVHAVGQQINVTAGDRQTALVFVRAAGRFQALVGFNDAANGAGGNKAFVQVDLHAKTAAAVVSGSGVVDAFTLVQLSDGWFCVWLRGKVGVATTFFSVRLGDGTGNFTYTGDATSGMAVWGATAVHPDTKFVASYTPSTSAADVLSAPFAPAPQVGWVYAQFVEEGGKLVPSGSFTSVATVGNFTSPNWRWALYVSGAGTLASFSSGNSVAQVTATLAADWNVGDSVELLGLVFADGSVRLIKCINGGSETVSSTTAANAQPAAFGVPTIWVGNDNGTQQSAQAIGVVRVGSLALAGVGAVTTIAQARAA